MDKATIELNKAFDASTLKEVFPDIHAHYILPVEGEDVTSPADTFMVVKKDDEDWDYMAADAGDTTLPGYDECMLLFFEGDTQGGPNVTLVWDGECFIG